MEHEPADDGDGTGRRAHDTIDVWYRASVWCHRVSAATVSGIVYDRSATAVIDLVVRDDERPHDQYLVALHDVETAERNALVVSLSVDALRARPLPTASVQIDDVDQLWWTDLELGVTEPWMVHPEPVPFAVPEPDLPSGQLLVANPAVVVGEWHVGHLSGVRVDRTTGHAGALIVDVGHRWHHRHVLVPSDAVDDVSEVVVRVRGTRAQLRHRPQVSAAGRVADLVPEAPADAGVAADDPDTAHVEAAHLLADQAEDALRARGFTRAQVIAWADAFMRDEGSGDITEFFAWVEARERSS